MREGGRHLTPTPCQGSKLRGMCPQLVGHSREDSAWRGVQRACVGGLPCGPTPAHRTLSPEASCAALECAPCWAWSAQGPGHTPPITGWPPHAPWFPPPSSICWGPCSPGPAGVFHVNREGGTSLQGRGEVRGRPGPGHQPVFFKDPLPHPPPLSLCPTDIAEHPQGGYGGPDGGRKGKFLPA